MNLETLFRHYPKILSALEENGEPFTGPSLFIRGGNSDYILDEDEQDIQRLFPEATLVTVPEAGHWVHAEKPEELFQAVSGFLEG